MSEQNPTDENTPAEAVGSVPTGEETPASPTPEATPTGEPSPEEPGASPSPQAHETKEVPITALHEERNKRQALEQEIAQLKFQQEQFQQQQYQQPQQQQVDPQAELEKVWEEDPKKAVRLEIMYAMDWRDRIDSSLEVQADQLARKFPDFNQYRSTALGQVRSLPLNQRGGPGILEAAYFMVRGQNTDQLIKQQEQELLEKYRRGDISAQGLATPPGAVSAPAPSNAPTATEEEERVAAAMGLSTEQYMSGRVAK